MSQRDRVRASVEHRRTRMARFVYGVELGHSPLPVAMCCFDDHATGNPFLGEIMLTAKAHRGGGDGYHAVAAMGTAAAAYRATRVLIGWDEQRLREDTGGVRAAPTDGLAIVEAVRHETGHILDWRPYHVSPDPVTLWWLPGAQYQRDAALPGPIGELLHRWRNTDVDDPADTLVQFDLEGYGFTAPDPSPTIPTWR